MARKVLIIGAVALGPKVACRLRRLDSEAEILMIDRDSRISYGGCGIPFYVGGDVAELAGLQSTSFHVTRDEAFFRDYKYVDVRTGVEALAIDRKAKAVRLRELSSGREYDESYDKLVLGTGASPFVPPVPGADLPGVTAVANLHQAEAIKNRVSSGQVGQAVIIGAGAIGLEMAEALADLWGVEVTVVEMADQILPQALGPEMATLVRGEYERNGVSFVLGEVASEIVGGTGAGEGVTAVKTSSGREIAADLVIFGVGVRPNASLAAEAGLAVGRFGGVLVDETMRTSDPDIFAGGDCVEVKNLITGQYMNLPLGSLANRQGRVIANNVRGGHDTFAGAVGSFCIKSFGLGVARAGLTAKQALQAGFDAAHATVAQADRAHFHPEQSLMYMKLVADRATRRVLGVEAVGENADAVKARVDAVAAVLPFKATVADISNLEVAYAPPLASAMDIVNAAGNALANILDGLNRPMEPEEFMAGVESGAFRVLDIRDPRQAGPYRKKYGERWLNIPQHELRERADELKGSEPLVLFCNSGVRSYECQRFLREQGICDVPHVQGGHGLLRKLDACFCGEGEPEDEPVPDGG